MIPVLINDQTYLFSVNHITGPLRTRLIYGICLNGISYFLAKSPGHNDCEQLDSNLRLDGKVLDEISSVITEIELHYPKRPALELINAEISGILARIRGLRMKRPNLVAIAIKASSR
jgi:hypothetical protein